jgi:predicted DNA binding CopG/RHH family protein
MYNNYTGIVHMTVKKPLEKQQIRQEIDIEELISKGARVIADNELKKKATCINLRLPTSMLDEIDLVLSKKVGISRTGWILQAIHEKLMKE